jgi:hypothetical protein
VIIMYRLVAAACAALLLVPLASAAQDPAATPPPASQPPEAAPATRPPAATEEERKKLEADIARELGASPADVRPPTRAVGGREAAALPGAPSSRPAGASPYARLLFLPDISAIGRAAVAFNDYDVEAVSPRAGSFSPEGEPRALFEELELGLQAVVDPYVRADVFVSLGDEGAEIEEAFATTLSLPYGLQARAGKFFSPFGRQTQQHPHVWEFVDAPLAVSRLLAEETLGGPGLEVGWLAPLPWFAELRFAGQSTSELADELLAEGDEEPGPSVTGVVRLLQYFPLGERTTLGVGLSAARRDEGRSAFRDLGGVDVHLRWRPLESRSYLSLQGELYGRRFRGVEDSPGSDTGGYGQVFWKQGAYYGLGARYDWAPTGEGAEPGTERKYGVLAGWFPSEFQRVRLQVSQSRRPGGDDGFEALLHLEFGFGAHGAHPF